MNIADLPELALIAGPTASGKSALALALAEAVGGTILNADSGQVYKDLRIISARPSEEDERRATHRLYGYREATDLCSAADWAREAKAAILGAHEEGRLPILVGGTGLYLRTLLDGIAPVPDIDAGIRAAVRGLPVSTAHAALRREDSEAAARLNPTDSTRVARALEVVRSTGRPLSHWQKQRVGGIGVTVRLRPLLPLPPRPWLYARCDQRFESMMSNHGLAEVSSLLALNLPPDLPIMRAIGVREVAAFLRGEATREESLAAGRQATRRYAKRQYTWFAHQPPPEWPRFTAPLEGDAVSDALTLLLG